MAQAPHAYTFQARAPGKQGPPGYTDPPLTLTIGELRRSRTMLEFVCGKCGSARLFDPSRLPFGPLQPVATAHRRMRCGYCGHDGDCSYTRPAWVGSASRIAPARSL